jgi:hypothetical protein
VNGRQSGESPNQYRTPCMDMALDCHNRENKGDLLLSRILAGFMHLRATFVLILPRDDREAQSSSFL